MKCPICESELKIAECHDDHILLESESKCINCQRYKEYYAYGCTEAGVLIETSMQSETGKWLTWQWSAETCIQNRGMISMKIEWTAKVARNDWLRQQKDDLVQ